MTEKTAMRIILRYVHGKHVAPEAVYRALGAVMDAYDRMSVRDRRRASAAAWRKCAVR